MKAFFHEKRVIHAHDSIYYRLKHFTLLFFSSSFPSSLLFQKSTLIMSCIFSGIFYVESLSSNHQLQCVFKDENNVIHHLNLTHFQSSDVDNHSFSNVFEMIQSES